MSRTRAILPILLLFVAASVTVALREARAKEKILYPGSGYDKVRIGGPWRPNPSKDVTHVPGPGASAGRRVVERIEVKSSDFVLAGSQLRVGKNTLRDVRLYYGNGETTYAAGRIVIRFPSDGVEFTVDRKREFIECITVFRPEVRERERMRQQRPYR